MQLENLTSERHPPSVFLIEERKPMDSKTQHQSHNAQLKLLYTQQEGNIMFLSSQREWESCNLPT